MKSRIYKITELATGKVRIIEATSVAHAMKHVAETTHTCVVSNGVDAVKLIAEGVKFESAVKAVDNEMKTPRGMMGSAAVPTEK